MNNQQILPYVISISFDKSVESVSDRSWAIGADIQIGDKLLSTSSYPRQLFGRVSDGNIHGNFMFVVCSEEFKKNPTYNYSKDIERAYVQDRFNEDDAIKHITHLVDGIGKVSLDDFTDIIHSFLLTEEWDWLMSNSKP